MASVLKTFLVPDGQINGADRCWLVFEPLSIDLALPLLTLRSRIVGIYPRLNPLLADNTARLECNIRIFERIT